MRSDAGNWPIHKVPKLPDGEDGLVLLHRDVMILPTERFLHPIASCKIQKLSDPMCNGRRDQGSFAER